MHLFICLKFWSSYGYLWLLFIFTRECCACDRVNTIVCTILCHIRILDERPTIKFLPPVLRYWCILTLEWQVWNSTIKPALTKPSELWAIPVNDFVLKPRIALIIAAFLGPFFSLKELLKGGQNIRHNFFLYATEVWKIIYSKGHPSEPSGTALVCSQNLISYTSLHYLVSAPVASSQFSKNSLHWLHISPLCEIYMMGSSCVMQLSYFHWSWNSWADFNWMTKVCVFPSAYSVHLIISEYLVFCWIKRCLLPLFVYYGFVCSTIATAFISVPLRLTVMYQT